MKYFILAIVLVVVITVIVIYFIRKRWAIKKVKCLTDEEKFISLDAALNPFGFAFDLNCDIVVSRNDAWQRNFGYMDFYDKKAPFFNMVFDAEPICFDYDGKEYRIEFWKGQYGITTGAEVGVYIHDCNCPKDFYRAACDDERLDISFVLNKKCNLFCRCDKSWWLTGFDVGNFSKPKELKMDICIRFPNSQMQLNFVNALIKNGYSECQLNICDNKVCFEYCCPNYYKPNKMHFIIKCLAQIMNYINTHMYMFFTRYFNRTIDKLTYTRFMFPCVYNFIIRLCVPRRKIKCRNKKKFN